MEGLFYEFHKFMMHSKVVFMKIENNFRLYEQQSLRFQLLNQIQLNLEEITEEMLVEWFRAEFPAKEGNFFKMENVGLNGENFEIILNDDEMTRRFFKEMQIENECEKNQWKTHWNNKKNELLLRELKYFLNNSVLISILIKFIDFQKKS